MLKVFNTLRRKLEEFKPLEKNKVKMYNCGPTVYNFAHIGNFRAYVCSDILRRYLEYSGYDVFQVMNLTDVDDKTIRDSQKEGIGLIEFTERYNKAFFEDIETLNLKRAKVFPKATEHIKEMIELIKKLEKNGHTYIQDGSVYFKISSFKNYGKLAGLNFKADELQAGSRVKADEYEKENAQDFALWKAWDPNDGDVFWETEYGKGRPGWHIECSAMSGKYLGESFDIHTGGIDLIFPHHTNEIAQSEGAFGKNFVNYWLHNEYMMVEGKKMSKRFNNFYTLRDVLAMGYSPKAVRYLLLSTNYRQPLNFTFDGLKAAQQSVDRMFEFLDKSEMFVNAKNESNDKKSSKKYTEDSNKKVIALITKVNQDFEKEMDNDLNTSGALAAIFDFMREINALMLEQSISSEDADRCVMAIREFDEVLGVLEREKESLDKEVEALIEKREAARKKKDFKAADKIRDELKERGILLDDTPFGVKWRKA